MEIDPSKVETTYPVSGGGEVTVLRPFDGKVYVGIFSLSGRYPQNGSYAVNVRRREFVKILSKSLTYTVGDEERTLTAGMSTWIEKDVPYTISGNGESLVIVEDEPEPLKGETQIRPGSIKDALAASS